MYTDNGYIATNCVSETEYEENRAGGVVSFSFSCHARPERKSRPGVPYVCVNRKHVTRVIFFFRLFSLLVLGTTPVIIFFFLNTKYPVVGATRRKKRIDAQSEKDVTHTHTRARTHRRTYARTRKAIKNRILKHTHTHAHAHATCVKKIK